jgi:hypothetical protein
MELYYKVTLLSGSFRQSFGIDYAGRVAGGKLI